MADKKNIKYQIIDHVADIGEADKKGFVKEVNVMTWGNSKNPVIDIRKWNREDDIMGKGISFSLEDFKQLQKINTANLEAFFESDEENEEEE